MEELSFLLLLLIPVVAIPVLVHTNRLRREARRRDTIAKMCKHLFPGDKMGLAKDEVIGDIMKMTSGRFSEEELLDYYLKIKGLQMLDLNSLNDSDIREFLMEPTKVRLHYQELVSFYEKYLNQPQAKGMSAV